MEVLELHLVDFVLFGIMVGLSGVMGIYFGCFGSKQKTTSEYLLGGRKLKVFPVSMSMVASTLSGISLLGLPAEIYLYGMQPSMLMLPIVFVGIINNYLFLPIFHKLKLFNPYDYLELRFDRTIKKIALVFYLISTLLFLPMVIYAPSLALNEVTGFDHHIIGSIMTFICLFYTTIAGLKGVVYSDNLQFCVTLSTLAFVFILGIKSVGGLGVIWEKSRLGDRLEFFNMDFDPTIRNTFWTVVIGDFGTWVAFVCIEPGSVQRLMAVPTFRDAQKCILIFVTFSIITKFIGTFSGLIMYTKYFDCDPLSAGYIKKADQIVPYYVLNITGTFPGMSGLFIAGLFSTTLSTLSTYLNAISGIIYNDFVALFMPKNTSDQKAIALMKVITVAIGILSFLLVFVIEHLGTIVEITTAIKGLTMGPVLGLFIFGMFFPQANTKGAYFGASSSFLFLVYIFVQSKLYASEGRISSQIKPLGTHGCNVTIRMPESGVVFNNTSSHIEEPYWLYRISFRYYILISILVTVTVGFLISLITRNKNQTQNSDLLCPWLKRFYSQSPNRSQEQEIQLFTDKEKLEANTTLVTILE